MRSAAQKRADAKYQDQHKKVVTINKQTPTTEHPWKATNIVMPNTPPKPGAPPANTRYCTRCECAGHGVDEHMSLHAFESKGIPTDGHRMFNPNDLDDDENTF